MATITGRSDGGTSGAARRTGTARTTTGLRALAVLGALLCLGVTYVHLADQGGYRPSEWFPGSKDPAYIKYGYYALEAAGVVAALLVLLRSRFGWLLALGVAAGPLAGFILTRTVGLPDATDDIGNWGEPLGIASMVVEGLLLLLALSQLGLGLARRRR